MIQVGEILGFGLQGRLQRERGASTTRLLELLREKMDTADRMVRRKTLSERLGLKGISCCGATWRLRTSNIIVRRDDDDNGEEGREGAQAPETHEIIDVIQTAPESGTTQACLGQIPSASGMNLAAALAAERNFRAGQDSYGSRSDSSPRPISPDIQGMNHGTTGSEQGIPFRVSLMKLLEETDGSDAVIEKEEKEGGGVGCDSMCCVCMVRKKGAAFIPCGHTYCRVCSRELWLNRGFCPLCNRSIIEILDIF